MPAFLSLTPFRTRQRQGALFCVLSAAAFALLGIFAKLAYRAEIDVATLLSLRYALASLLFWSLVARRPRQFPSPIVFGKCLVIGIAGDGAYAAFFFYALTRIDASLAILLLYAYPAIVLAVTCVLRARLPHRRSLPALGAATIGVTLLLSGGSTGGIDGLGVLLALASALVLAIYILLVERMAGDVDPLLLSSLVCTGAAITFTGFSLMTGGLDLSFGPSGWAVLTAIALISTAVANFSLFAGVSVVGASSASILLTIEAPLTVLFAFLFLGEGFGSLQAVGGLLVVSAALALAVWECGPGKEAAKSTTPILPEQALAPILDTR